MAAEVLVPLTIFMTPVLLYFTKNYFRMKEKQLELQAQGGKLLPPAPAPAPDAQRLKELEERVQNLESIVIALDTDRAALPGRATAALPQGEQAGQLKLASKAAEPDEPT